MNPEKYVNQLYLEAFDLVGSKKKAANVTRWAFATLLKQSADYGQLIHHESGLRLGPFYEKCLAEVQKLP
jgi:hypothetical protein